MVAAARALNPDRPGAFDLPAWDIGRRWCQARGPGLPDLPDLPAEPCLPAPDRQGLFSAGT